MTRPEDRPRAGRPTTDRRSAELDDYAGEVQVRQGPPPRWLAMVPYLAIAWALGYYVYVRATDPVNLAFAGLFLAWCIYTPIAKKRGWFFMPM